MIRSMMQTYVTGSAEAVALYQKAFDAPLISEYKHEDGSYYHSELVVYGQVLAVSERMESEESAAGNTMQFCLHFGKEERACVEKAYGALKDGARILFPLGPCDFSSCLVDLIDRFGVRWCIFTD